MWRPAPDTAVNTVSATDLNLGNECLRWGIIPPTAFAPGNQVAISEASGQLEVVIVNSASQLRAVLDPLHGYRAIHVELWAGNGHRYRMMDVCGFATVEGVPVPSEVQVETYLRDESVVTEIWTLESADFNTTAGDVFRPPAERAVRSWDAMSGGAD